jgi:hypothetical protein
MLPCIATAELLQVRIAPVVTVAAVLMMREAAFAFENVACRKWQFWRGTGQEATALHIYGGLAGIFRKYDGYRVKLRVGRSLGAWRDGRPLIVIRTLRAHQVQEPEQDCDDE